DIRLEYDATGRVNAVRYGEHVDRLVFTDAGVLESRSAPNGIVEQREYDDDGRLVTTTLRSASGELVYARRMGYDGIGRVSCLADALRGTRTMVYDEESRISRVECDGRGVVEEYRFDRHGGVLSSHRGAWERPRDFGQPCVAMVHREHGRSLRLE